METVLTHDNGGNPFQVRIDRDRKVVEVAVASPNPPTTFSPWKTFSYEEIFVGQGTYDSLEFCTFSYGNSMLLHVHGPTYVYIGEHVVQFESRAPIAAYVATVGNSDVVYAYALDKADGCVIFQGNSPVQRVRSLGASAKPSEVYGHFYATPAASCEDLPAQVLHRRLW